MLSLRHSALVWNTHTESRTVHIDPGKTNFGVSAEMQNNKTKNGSLELSIYSLRSSCEHSHKVAVFPLTWSAYTYTYFYYSINIRYQPSNRQAPNLHHVTCCLASYSRQSLISSGKKRKIKKKKLRLYNDFRPSVMKFPALLSESCKFD